MFNAEGRSETVLVPRSGRRGRFGNDEGPALWLANITGQAHHVANECIPGPKTSADYCDASTFTALYRNSGTIAPAKARPVDPGELVPASYAVCRLSLSCRSCVIAAHNAGGSRNARIEAVAASPCD